MTFSTPFSAIVIQIKIKYTNAPAKISEIQLPTASFDCFFLELNVGNSSENRRPSSGSTSKSLILLQTSLLFLFSTERKKNGRLYLCSQADFAHLVLAHEVIPTFFQDCCHVASDRVAQN